ncbi:MAG TPA: hypothetical protein VMZ91_03935 [Candidatus Paceibacterota bacterium]|nr:hypothetical protein [Candidatus Paceibacterota bacterium]
MKILKTAKYKKLAILNEDLSDKAFKERLNKLNRPAQAVIRSLKSKEDQWNRLRFEEGQGRRLNKNNTPEDPYEQPYDIDESQISDEEENLIDQLVPEVVNKVEQNQNQMPWADKIKDAVREVVMSRGLDSKFYWILFERADYIIVGKYPEANNLID